MTRESTLGQRSNALQQCFVVAVAFLFFGSALAWLIGLQRVPLLEEQARFVEAIALSSVAASVPRRDIVRKAQAAAIMEAQRLGLQLSIASVGSGGRAVGATAMDERAFARLAQHFPQTAKPTEDGHAIRERLSKAWIAGNVLPSAGAAANGHSQSIADTRAGIGACVVELHAAGESLGSILTMAYAEPAITAIERRARSLGISADDVAFMVGAHESAHCVISVARRAGLVNESWVDPQWKIPWTWCKTRCADEPDSPVLAKAEESAADILAVLWAADAFGPGKAQHLLRLVIYARSLGAGSGSNDGLHDSSLALTTLLQQGQRVPLVPVTDPLQFAWTTAIFDTSQACRRQL